MTRNRVYTAAILLLFTAIMSAVDSNAISTSLNVSSQQERSRIRRQKTKYVISGDESVSTMIEKLMVNYNKQEPPMPDRPTLVSLGIYVISVYSISEQTMDYSVSMYLRQKWNDPRLQIPTTLKKFQQVRLGDGKWNDIWIPDTFLRNEKAANFHLVTVENRMLKLKANGDLWYVTKITATLSCPMLLQKFPMDTQTCPMLFESFGYTMDTLYFQPMPRDIAEPIDIAKDLQLPQFNIIRTAVHDCSQNYTTGAYPCLEFRFFLRRDLGYFLIQVYVPSILIVILSWVSFWINVDASPARVSIGLLTVLTTTTMSTGARATLPRVSYIKAIDVWMIICLLFVFLSLIEYAVVNVLARKPGRVAAKQKRQQAGQAQARMRNSSQMQGMSVHPMARKKFPTILGCFKINVPDNHPPGAAGSRSSAAAGPPEVDGKAEARRVDKVSRKIFPIAFVVFNLIYWFVYADPFADDFQDHPE